MAGEIQDLTSTAGSHARFPEFQAPSSLNDGARAVEGIIVRWFNDTNYSVAATVSGSVIQMTANRVSITLTGTTSNYMADLLMAFTMGSVANPDGCYLNINGIGKIGLRDCRGASLSASVIPSGSRALVTMDAANGYFRLLAPTGAPQFCKGTWTPTDQSGAGLTGSFTVNHAVWQRDGDIVTVMAEITWPVTASGASASIGGLPYPVPSAGRASCWCLASSSFALLASGTSNIGFFTVGGVAQSNANLSTGTVVINLTYSIA